jgi:hypothetical protein
MAAAALGTVGLWTRPETTGNVWQKTEPVVEPHLGQDQGVSSNVWEKTEPVVRAHLGRPEVAVRRQDKAEDKWEDWRNKGLERFESSSGARLRRAPLFVPPKGGQRGSQVQSSKFRTRTLDSRLSTLSFSTTRPRE